MSPDVSSSSAVLPRIRHIIQTGPRISTYASRQPSDCAASSLLCNSCLVSNKLTSTNSGTAYRPVLAALSLSPRSDTSTVDHRNQRSHHTSLLLPLDFSLTYKLRILCCPVPSIQFIFTCHFGTVLISSKISLTRSTPTITAVAS